jgi:hypothetical protein
VFRFSILPARPCSIVSSCIGAFEIDGCLLGLSNIESLHCLLPKPGLLACILVSSSIGDNESNRSRVNVRRSSRVLVLEATAPLASGEVASSFKQDMDEDAHRCVFRSSILLATPCSIVCSCMGEFGDGGCLNGLSNIESLNCLLPKPGLLAGFVVDAGSWTASCGTSLSQRFFFAFVSFFKTIGAWQSSIPIALRFVFSKVSEGNLGASWTMDTSSISTLPRTLARRSTRKEERLLLSIVVSFVGMPIGFVDDIKMGYCGRLYTL